MAKTIVSGLSSYTFLVLCLLAGIGQSRLLQERTYADYEIEASAIYGFAFNGTAPESLSADETEDLLRLTENFYMRVFASRFARSYQDVLLSYQSHDWQKEKDTLQLSFEALVTFREFDLVTAPTTEEVMDVMRNIDTDDYIEGFVMKAQPADFFLWTNYTNITASLKSEPSNPATQNPVAASTPVVPNEDNIIVTATSPPSLSQPSIPPTLPTQGNATTENGTVTTVITLSAQNQSQGITFDSNQATASDQISDESLNQMPSVAVQKSGGSEGGAAGSHADAPSSANSITMIPAFMMLGGYLLL